MESERYFKMQERILSKMHRDFLQTVASTGQTLVKKSRVKAAYDYRVKIKVIRCLKTSLSNIEVEALATLLASYTSKLDKKNPDTPLALAEQERFNILRRITQRWIQSVQELALKEDLEELKGDVGVYLSPNFVAVRETYLEELEKISTRDFSEKAIENLLKTAESHVGKNRVLNSVALNRRGIRILFPAEEYKKSLDFWAYSIKFLLS